MTFVQPRDLVDKYRDANSNQQSGQNECLTEEASRVNSNEKHKNGFHLGCASLNIIESNVDTASKGKESYAYRNG